MSAFTVAMGLAMAVAAVSAYNPTTRSPPTGSPDAVYEMVDRILPGQRRHFTFTVVPTCNAALTAPQEACFSDSSKGGKVVIEATGANELAAGLGHYLREHVGAVIGWPRGGGSHIVAPSNGWPVCSVSYIVPKQSHGFPERSADKRRQTNASLETIQTLSHRFRVGFSLVRAEQGEHLTSLYLVVLFALTKSSPFGATSTGRMLQRLHSRGLSRGRTR
jgi:hypothetical protein